jgi:hypothetical protein
MIVAPLGGSNKGVRFHFKTTDEPVVIQQAVERVFAISRRFVSP